MRLNHSINEPDTVSVPDSLRSEEPQSSKTVNEDPLRREEQERELVDRICDHFLHAWQEHRAGKIKRPHIKAFLDEAPDPLALLLLRELIYEDIEQRQLLEEIPSREDYQFHVSSADDMLAEIFQSDSPRG